MSPQVPVRRYTRRQPATDTRYVRRTPPPSDLDRLTPRIVELREAIDKRVGAYGAMKGVPISVDQIKGMEKTSKIEWDEHAAYQDTQTWAHASGIISTDEANVIYRSLGEVGSAENGGWAPGADLATKIIVLKTVQELMQVKLRKEGRL